MVARNNGPGARAPDAVTNTIVAIKFIISMTYEKQEYFIIPFLILLRLLL